MFLRFFLLRFPPAPGGFPGCFPGFYRSWTITAGQRRLWYQSTGLLGGERWSGWEKVATNPFDGLLKLVVGMRCGKNLRYFFLSLMEKSGFDLESRTVFILANVLKVSANTNSESIPTGPTHIFLVMTGVF